MSWDLKLGWEYQQFLWNPDTKNVTFSKSWFSIFESCILIRNSDLNLVVTIQHNCQVRRTLYSNQTLWSTNSSHCLFNELFMQENQRVSSNVQYWVGFWSNSVVSTLWQPKIVFSNWIYCFTYQNMNYSQYMLKIKISKKWHFLYQDFTDSSSQLQISTH